MSLSVPDFVTRWKASTLTERSAAQSRFNELCDVLDHPHPAEVDLTGKNFTFEAHAAKATAERVLPTCGSATTLRILRGALRSG